MYQGYLDTNVVPNSSYLWKIKLSLKIKIFLWLLYREAMLTKDNLVKRNWHSNERCCFCNNFETVQHLFFYCALAKFTWRVIDLFFGLGAPNNIRNMFGAWVQNMNVKNKRLFYVAIGVMLWSIWLSRNDIVFNKTPISSYLQGIFRGTHWTRMWAKFQKEENQNVLQTTCPVIETLIMEIFAKYGW
jgi:hypothetical protein